VDSKAACDQLNVAHSLKKHKKKKLKQTNASANLVQCRFNLQQFKVI